MSFKLRMHALSTPRLALGAMGWLGDLMLQKRHTSHQVNFLRGNKTSFRKENNGAKNKSKSRNKNSGGKVRHSS